MMDINDKVGGGVWQFLRVNSQKLPNPPSYSRITLPFLPLQYGQKEDKFAGKAKNSTN